MLIRKRSFARVNIASNLTGIDLDD